MTFVNYDVLETIEIRHMIHHASNGGKGYSIDIFTSYRSTIATAIEDTIALQLGKVLLKNFLTGLKD